MCRKPASTLTKTVCRGSLAHQKSKIWGQLWKFADGRVSWSVSITTIYYSITKASTNMSRIKIAGLALASMLVMSMAVTGSASAAPLWLVCLEGSGLTKYESSTCLKAASGGKWQSVGVTKAVTVKMVAISILLIDRKVPIQGEVIVRCSSKGSRGEGIVEPGGKGQITVAEVEKPGENCSSEKGCKAGTVKHMRAAHLPWLIAIFTTEGKQLTKIAPHAGGEQPGWEVECETEIGIAANDVCATGEGNEESVRLVNTFSSTELLVTALFEEKAKINCTIGGNSAGEIKGSVAILLPGGALSINPA